MNPAQVRAERLRLEAQHAADQAEKQDRDATLTAQTEPKTSRDFVPVLGSTSPTKRAAAVAVHRRTALRAEYLRLISAS